MELMLLCGVLISVLAISLFHYSSILKNSSKPRLPPGNTGWPVIGESFEFISNLQNGISEKFFFKRMAKYSPQVFKTSILGDNVTILCGVEGSKFLFSKTNKLVTRSMPWPIRKLMIPKEIEVMVDRHIRPAIHALIKPEVLKNFVGVMDSMAQSHMESCWHGNGQVLEVYTSIKKYTFELACRLFFSIEDPDVVKTLMDPMETISLGIQSLPINLPGTRMNRAIKASSYLRSQIMRIAKRQRSMQSSSGFVEHTNLLSYFLQIYDDDEIVAYGIVGVLFGGHETTASALSVVFKVMTDYRDVYEKVYQENMELRAKKKAGELLRWEDIEQLKYTWNVAREVMRLYSPAPYINREAITDFTYAGSYIPKGCKLMTSVFATHKDPKYFPEPEKFEPSRFDGDGPLPNTYLPFGGGSYLCPGRNYAQLEMLVFIHNAITKYKWESTIPDEKIIGIPFPKPAKGLPVILHYI